MFALTVYNGNLIASGDFSLAGGVLANSVAQWNGTSWSALGNGIDVGDGFTLDGSALALAVYGGNLIVDGDFVKPGTLEHLRQWNGTAWSALGNGTGVNNTIYALSVFNGSAHRRGVIQQHRRDHSSGDCRMVVLHGSVQSGPAHSFRCDGEHIEHRQQCQRFEHGLLCIPDKRRFVHQSLRSGKWFCGAAPAWQTKASWGTKTVTGLSANTIYTFDEQAAADASGHCPSAFGPSASGTTGLAPPATPVC